MPLTRERDRERKRRLRSDPAFRELENAKARERMARLAAERRGQRRPRDVAERRERKRALMRRLRSDPAFRARENAASRARHRLASPSLADIARPLDLRLLWSRAHPNSILRRLHRACPTVGDLPNWRER